MKPREKRNLTLSLPGDLIRQVKVIAAQQDKSINALVEEGLEKLVRDNGEYFQAVARILAPSRKGLYRAGKKVKREDLYDR